MKVVVEGNTAAKTLIVVLHGGPGGDAQIYNLAATKFSDPLEENYGLVYWDQRGSGNSAGTFSKDKLTMQQYVTDLERLLTLLEYQYGTDVNFFLLGHSWGGMLGTAFLTKPANQARVKGWMNVDGVVNFRDYGGFVYDALESTAKEQISANNFPEFWEEVQTDLSEMNRNRLTETEKLQLNNYGYRVDYYLRESGLVNEINAEAGQYAYFSYHDATLGVFNNFLSGSTVYQDIKDRDLTDQLPNIDVPALFMWGKYDLVVPTSIGKVAYEQHGSMEKELIIYEASGHSPMLNEAAVFSRDVMEFVERYR